MGGFVTSQGYPPRVRLRRPEEFKRVLAKGARFKSSAGHFDIKVIANDLGFARLGCIIPKRLTPLAVCRNRIRRLLREAFRYRCVNMTGVDLLVRQIAKVADPFETALSQEIEMLLLRFVDA